MKHFINIIILSGGLCLLLLITGSSAQTVNTVTGACPTSQWVNAVSVNDIKQGCAQITLADISGILTGASFGVVADGITPNDDAMVVAVSACSAIGGSLYLPAGGIRLAGFQSINLSSCHIIGQGTFIDAGQNHGSTFILTSTATPPFIVGNDWSFEGVNFYWPNQINGTTVYPPLFTDDGVHDAGHWKLHNVAIVNAYDGFVATGAVSWGGWFISDSFMYAVHDLFQIGVMGDFGNMSNVILDPGPWYQTLNFSTAVTNAVKAASQNNTIFHATGSSAILARNGIGGFEWRNISAFAWRNVVKQDDQSAINLTSIDISGDGIGTYQDTHLVVTANALSPGSIKWTCPDACGTGIPIGGTNYPAFDLSPLGTGGLYLDRFNFGSAVGTFVQTAGSTVHIKNSFINSGDPGDGGDYYVLKVTGAAGQKIRVLNSEFGGANTAHSHGIYKHVALPDIQIINNRFEQFNDAIDITDNDNIAPLIYGNVSQNTFGSKSVLVTATGQVNWWGNQFDKPPLAQVGSCGSGATITGTVAGQILVGSTNPTTSCTLTLPWDTNGDGLCSFGLSNGGAANYSVSTFHPLTLVITSATTMHGARLWYSCPGRQ